MTEKFKGHIVKWHDEKGFGFIKCQDLSEEIFFHISQYKGKQRPEINEQVVFTLGKNKQGKTQALQVQEWLFVRKQQRKHEHWQQQQDEFEHNRQVFTVFAIAPHILLAAAWLIGKVPTVLPLWYIIFSLMAFAAYAKDKYAAENGSWRTPENTLHMLSLFGGWSGAWLAQIWLRHKSKKTEFRRIYWLTVLINLSLLFYLLFSPSGHRWLSIWR